MASLFYSYLSSIVLWAIQKLSNCNNNTGTRTSRYSNVCRKPVLIARSSDPFLLQLVKTSGLCRGHLLSSSSSSSTNAAAVGLRLWVSTVSAASSCSPTLDKSVRSRSEAVAQIYCHLFLSEAAGGWGVDEEIVWSVMLCSCLRTAFNSTRNEELCGTVTYCLLFSLIENELLGILLSESPLAMREASKTFERHFSYYIFNQVIHRSIQFPVESNG